MIGGGGSASRPATDGGVMRRRAVSVDPEAMMGGGEGIRRLSPLSHLDAGRISPLRYRAREEDRLRGSLSPSRFLDGGEFQPEYSHKNTFAGARRGFSIRAGLPYVDSTYDHINTLLMQKTPKLRQATGKPETPVLPRHLLALKNIGTKRWRKAYERGATDFVSDVAQIKHYLNPRDSRIFDLWGADKQAAPPAPISRVDTPDNKKSKNGGGKEKKGYSMHLMGEPATRDSTVYHFASVLHPQNHMHLAGLIR